MNVNRRIAAVKTAYAINRIEGAPVSMYAQQLARHWSAGELTDSQMKQALMDYHIKLSRQVDKRA